MTVKAVEVCKLYFTKNYYNPNHKSRASVFFDFLKRKFSISEG